MDTITKLNKEQQCIGCGERLPGKYIDRRLCRHCFRSNKAWKIEGLQLMHQYAREDKSLSRFEDLEFCDRFYTGKSIVNHYRMQIFETALKIIGWKGRITDKRRRYIDYQHARFHGIHQNQRRVISEGKCVICGRSDIQLYYHHLFPITWGGNASDPANGVVVCKIHHLELHKRLRKKLNRTLLVKYLEPYKEEIRNIVQESLPESLKNK